MNTDYATSSTNPHIAIYNFGITNAWYNHHYPVIAGQTLDIEGITNKTELAFTD
jgi:hypothetical protein